MEQHAIKHDISCAGTIEWGHEASLDCRRDLGLGHAASPGSCLAVMRAPDLTAWVLVVTIPSREACMLTAEPLSSKACRNDHSRKGLTSPLPVAQASHSACDTCGMQFGFDGGCVDQGVWSSLYTQTMT